MGGQPGAVQGLLGGLCAASRSCLHRGGPGGEPEPSPRKEEAPRQFAEGPCSLVADGQAATLQVSLQKSQESPAPPTFSCVPMSAVTAGEAVREPGVREGSRSLAGLRPPRS